MFSEEYDASALLFLISALKLSRYVPGSIFISLILIFSTIAAVDSSIKTDAPVFYKKNSFKNCTNCIYEKENKNLYLQSHYS